MDDGESGLSFLRQGSTFRGKQVSVRDSGATSDRLRRLTGGSMQMMVSRYHLCGCCCPHPSRILDRDDRQEVQHTSTSAEEANESWKVDVVRINFLFPFFFFSPSLYTHI